MPPDEDFAVEVRFEAVAVFLLPEVFGVTFFAGDFAPLVVFRVFDAVDFDPPVERPPEALFDDDTPVVRVPDDPPLEVFLDDDFPLDVFLEDDAEPEVFLEDDAEPEVFLEDAPPEVFLVVDRAPAVDLRAVELPPDFAPPARPLDFAPLDVVFLEAEDLAPAAVPFFAEDAVEPDAFFAVVFLAGDFFAVDAVFDFDPALEVDFDEGDFLAEDFDEVFFVVAIGPPVIKVLKSSLAN